MHPHSFIQYIKLLGTIGLPFIGSPITALCGCPRATRPSEYSTSLMCGTVLALGTVDYNNIVADLPCPALFCRYLQF